MLIAECLKNYDNGITFKIFATDIDQRAIKKAGSGLYHESIVSDVPAKYLDKYFHKVAAGYRIKKTIRDNLVFTVHDALRDPPFINMDLLVCRNMMIYLSSDIQRRLLRSFRFALNYKGYLFLGPSESITPVKMAFEPINNRWNIFKHISKENPLPISRERKLQISPNPRIHSSTVNYHPSTTEFSIGNKTEDFIAQTIAAQHGPRSLFVKENLDIIYINGKFNDILEFPKAFTNMNLLSMVKEEEHILFRSGVRKTFSSNESSLYKNVQLKRDNRDITADIFFSVFKHHHLDEPLVWITFDTEKDHSLTDSSKINVIGFEAYKKEGISALELELVQLKKEKQYFLEQLEAANEELQSSNEELLAANEELQSTNEELQSVNEELYTVNTELQSKINELIISNNDVTNLLKNTDIGIIFLDKNLCIRKYTPALKYQFNLQEADIGRSISDFTNSFSKDITEEIRLVLDSGESIEREIVDQAGNYFLMRLLPYRLNNETLDGVVVAFIDLNEIKEAQKAVIANAKKYETIFHYTNNLIMTLEKDGTITSVNHNTVADSESLVGKKFYGVPGVEQEIRVNALNKVIQNKSPFSYTATVPTDNGLIRWFDAVIVPIIHDDEIQSLILIAYDITEHKLTEDALQSKSDDLERKLFSQNNELEGANRELKEVNSYLDSFVHGAAHDLRAPLAQMKGMMKLFPKMSSEQQVKKMLEQFNISVEQMDSTLSGLIELIEFQQNTADMVSGVDLKEELEAVIAQLEPDLKAAKAELIVNLEHEDDIYFIPAYIKSIFYNLLSNAIKYRAYERPLIIEVNTVREENFYLISVTDNGIGMDLKKYGHLLFAPFKRLTVERSGMGIGLSIINSAIKKAGGRIEVKSQLNIGTQFDVYISPMQLVPKRIDQPMLKE